MHIYSNNYYHYDNYYYYSLKLLIIIILSAIFRNSQNELRGQIDKLAQGIMHRHANVLIIYSTVHK